MYGPLMYFGPIEPEPEPKRCHFCQDKLLHEDGDDEIYLEEVGEFWSEVLQRAVLAHPECLPMGIEATLSGDDPEWKMA